jgi:predicted ATPase/DNA-binding SARP family transcriptional activator
MASKGTSVQLELLGPLELRLQGQVVHAGGPKQRALLAYLALHVNEFVQTPILINAVWGDDPFDSAVRSLRTYVSNLRKILGSAAEISSRRGSYRLSLQSTDTDVERFRSAVHTAADMDDVQRRRKTLRSALDLWRGPFLADIDRNWVQEEGVILGWERQRAVAAWAEDMIDIGEVDEVLPELEHEVSQNPLDEQINRLLIRALYGSGRQTDALAVYRRLRNLLAVNLGVEPGPELRLLEEQILLHDAAVSSRISGRSIPSPVGELIGREVEVVELRAQLEHVRLLTLTGPGGVGKTRLALEVARRVSQDGDQPVYFADLASVSDPSILDAVLASCAGVQPHPDTGPIESLVEYLGSKEVLLIVDNCEHVAGEIARSLETILRRCSGVTILATSRSPLRIEGEAEWRTPSLATPADVEATLDIVRQASAVILLLRRTPFGFELTESNSKQIAQLCQRLDGLPLAIEIAATRMGSMTPGEILATLDSGAEVSQESMADDSRHATLASTINWSYELLSPEERGLLDRLGVMSGTFLLEDVVAVCTSVGGDPGAVRACLSTLVEQSLVSADISESRTRYRLLETIRRFALAQLGDSDTHLRHRHARHYSQLAEFHARRLLTHEEADAFVELSAAHENIRQAVEWAMEVDDVAIVSRIVASVADWGYFRSHYELSRWAEWAWNQASPQDPLWRAVCGSAARGAWVGGRFSAAIQFATAATELGTVIARSGDPDDVVADVALYCGDVETALGHYCGIASSSLDRSDLERRTWANYYVALISTVLGQSNDAVEAARRALDGAREIGNPSALAFSMYASALAVKHRSPTDAMAMFGEAILTADSVGNDWIGGISRMELASTRTRYHDTRAGLIDFATVIDHWHRVGDDTQLRLTWRYLVSALIDAGSGKEAAILTGALLAADLPSLTHPNQRTQDTMDETLGRSQYARLKVQGSIMSVPDLVRLSLDAVSHIISDLETL